MSSKDYKTIIEVVRKQNNKSCHLITTLQKSEIKDSLKLSEELDYQIITCRDTGSNVKTYKQVQNNLTIYRGHTPNQFRILDV